MTSIRQKGRPAAQAVATKVTSPTPRAKPAALPHHRDQFLRGGALDASRQVLVSRPQPHVGKKALDAFFSAHVKHSQAATGVKELLAEGSLSDRAVARLEAQGVGTTELEKVAKDLEPFFAELGVAGEAMAKTAVDCLVEAGGELGRLAQRKSAEVVERMLPLHLADGLTRQLGAAVNTAARELLQTGLVSADSFAKLGAQGLGQLALALEVGLRQVGPLAQQAGGALLRQTAEALGKASELLKPGASYPDFVGAFMESLPTSGKPLWEEKRSTQTRVGDAGPNGELPGRGALDQKPMEAFAGTTGSVEKHGDTTVMQGRAGAVARAGGDVQGEHSFNSLMDMPFGLGGQTNTVGGAASYTAEAWAGAEGRTSVGPTSADAWGRAGTGASFHGEASGALKAENALMTTSLEGSAVADGQVYAGYEGRAHVGLDGANVHLRAGASAEASAQLEVSQRYETLGGNVSAEGDLQVYGEARAAAQVTAEGHVGFDEEGDVEAYVGVSAELIAEASAGAKESLSFNFFGFELTVGAYAAVAASAGVKAGAGAGYRDGEFYALADVGAGAAAGGDLGGFAKLEMPPWAQAVMNTLGKTEGGRAALGAVGMVLNPLIGMVAQAVTPPTTEPAPAT